MSKMSRKQQRLMKEELTRTQVLNLTDLQKVAKYEKSISKRPAITLAILGLFMIITGFSYNGIINFLTKVSSPPEENIYHKEVGEEEEEINTSTVKCSFILLGNPDGTDTALNVTLNLVDDKLINYNKVATYVPSVASEQLGVTTIKAYLPAFQSLSTIAIPGYSLKVLPKGTGFETNVNIDLENIDGSLLTANHQWNASTNVEFALGDTKEMILTRAASYGYQCQ